MAEEKKRIVILGGGFGGVYTAMYLQKLIKKTDWEIVIINRENYFVYQPMLSEVVGGTLGILDTISSIERLVPNALLINREIEEINTEKKEIVISPKFSHTAETVKYDHLVVALGNVTDFRDTTGLHEHALPFKNLADTLQIRNHLIDVIETANVTQDPELKKQLLTFVVAGGGFSGTEMMAEVNDFARKMAKTHQNIDEKELHMILIHSKSRLMDAELSESLSHYVEKILKRKGVEIWLERKLTSATPVGAVLDNGEKIPSQTVISTVPSSPNPIVEASKLPLENGRIKTDGTMLVEGTDHVWSLGDCARIPLNGEQVCPPTAQFAVRQAKVLALNIQRTIEGKERKPFYFKSLGMLGALGHHNAFAEFFGKIRLSGLFAWFLWRFIYWVKLPGITRKIKVAFSWFLDTLFPSEMVQLKIAPLQGISKLHFETGEVVFNEGDIGDYLYIISSGKVEVIKKEGGKIAELGKGDFFGEIAILKQKTRTATIKCLEPTNILALRESDFGVLIDNFKDLRETFEKTGKKRES